MLEKQRATFEFEVNEDDIEGRWLRNGVEIQFSVDQRFNYAIIRKVHRLTITETYRSDAGEYTFIAGKNRSVMTLRVNSECDQIIRLRDVIYYLFLPNFIALFQSLSLLRSSGTCSLCLSKPANPHASPWR